MTKRMTDKDIILNEIGEGFHTAFRKALLSEKGDRIATQIHKLITELPKEDWNSILEWVWWAGLKDRIREIKKK